ALLLEQSIAAGMGNLYADEALYLSGINPMRPGSELSADEVARLRASMVDALTAGVALYDQSRIDNWPDPPRALTTWTIPRQKGDACLRCHGPMEVTRIRARSTWFCPRCQV
ncbi:MAG: DNA-formamidopyrimidine glycosylase, partial [Chloroflexi bacterium]|nr:DNA-formamidopyrimidine glycosylase [Chloroflexota bacterium]